MTKKDATELHAKVEFWDNLEEVHAVMLMIESSGQHPQPMAPQLDPDSNTIWFFTNRESDLFGALATSELARLIFVGKNHNYHASVSGSIRENKNADKVNEYWNPVIAAWFDGGKDDPNMTLLQMDCAEAIIWASSGNPIKFAWEIAKANLKNDDPDMGTRTIIRF